MRYLLIAVGVLLSGCSGKYVCFPVKNCKATYRVYYYAGILDGSAEKIRDFDKEGYLK